MEVTFAVADAGTRVELTHSGFEAMATQTSASALRADYASGWDFVLGECYLQGCTRPARQVMV